MIMQPSIELEGINTLFFSAIKAAVNIFAGRTGQQPKEVHVCWQQSSRTMAFTYTMANGQVVTKRYQTLASVYGLGYGQFSLVEIS